MKGRAGLPSRARPPLALKTPAAWGCEQIMTTQNENKSFGKASPVRAVITTMIVGIMWQAIDVLVILSML